MIPPLQNLLNQKRGEKFSPIIFALDPGLTTGWCVFKADKVVEHGQLEKSDPVTVFKFLQNTHKKHKVDYIVCENYRIYETKAKAHINSEVIVAQLIGSIKVAAEAMDIPLKLQMAGLAKGFATDDKLREWGFWKVGMRHSRDAIRHAIYFSLFGKLS